MTASIHWPGASRDGVCKQQPAGGEAPESRPPTNDDPPPHIHLQDIGGDIVSLIHYYYPPHTL